MASSDEAGLGVEGRAILSDDMTEKEEEEDK